MKRAIVQYHTCGCPHSCCYPKDYKLGYIAGFYEVATGGSDCPPVIAPSRYWKPEQVLGNCDKRRQCWYSGWQDGAARAVQFPDTHHLKIWETCECPMPRCEQPCGVGCGPCGQAATAPACGGGICHDSAMIEHMPVAPMASPMPVEHAAPTVIETMPAPTAPVELPVTPLPADAAGLRLPPVTDSAAAASLPIPYEPPGEPLAPPSVREAKPFNALKPATKTIAATPKVIKQDDKKVVRLVPTTGQVKVMPASTGVVRLREAVKRKVAQPAGGQKVIVATPVVDFEMIESNPIVELAH
ncbi:MAG: hypothetical protein AAGD07_02045 [Planctomycetota bacterium]